MTRTVVGIAAMTIGALALLDCSMVRVTSDPRGAALYYSETGTPPWRPWPPGRKQPATTPKVRFLWPEPYVYLRAAEGGYYPEEPVFLDARMFRSQRIHFDLEKSFDQLQRDQGYVWFRGEWMTPEEKFRRQQEEIGLYYYERTNEWVSAEELAHRVAEEQREQGFVRYKGNWVKPEEEGLVEYKGRWMKPEEAEIRRLIDEEVQRIVQSGDTFPFEIERIGPTFTAGAQMRVADLTGHPLEVLLSGPESQRVEVSSYNSITMVLEPGTYTLTILQADQPPAPAAVDTRMLETKSRYSAVYRGLGEDVALPPVDVPPLEPPPTFSPGKDVDGLEMPGAETGGQAMDRPLPPANRQ